MAAAFGFAMMSLFVKLAGDLPAFQKAFFRNFVALIFIFIMMLREKVSFIPPKEHIPDLLGRSFFGTMGLLCNFYALLGGMGAGIAYTFVRRLGQKQENSRRIVFFFSAFSCILCLPFLIAEYEHMSFLQLLYLILAGTFACIGQLGITKAYICAPAREISVYDYTQVIFAAVLGFFVFGDIPDWLSVFGYVLIIGAGVAMFFYNKKRAE